VNTPIYGLPATATSDDVGSDTPLSSSISTVEYLEQAVLENPGKAEYAIRLIEAFIKMEIPYTHREFFWTTLAGPYDDPISAERFLTTFKALQIII
jgi:hypothetical protein